jgi:guanosine-3',5'-bis(diphosphate) 3'-pyrophosphohydrolase
MMKVSVLEAARFAAERHRDQRRKGASQAPYVNHVIEVAAMLEFVGGVQNASVLAAALLHDTVEDTGTRLGELHGYFNTTVAGIVVEVTDDKSLPKEVRKRLQVERAPKLSPGAKLIRLADKICNVRDLGTRAPAGWSLERKRQYFEWAKEVVDRLRGTHAELERRFDEVYALKP